MSDPVLFRWCVLLLLADIAAHTADSLVPAIILTLATAICGVAAVMTAARRTR